jgi:glucose dehydrogenase
MWPLIRTVLLRPQTIVVLALLFLVTDALLSIFSPASAAAHPDRLHPADFPGTEMLLEAPYDDDDWLLPAKTYAGNRYTGLTQIDKINVGNLRIAWETAVADDGEQEAAPLIWNGTMYLSTPHDGVLALDASNSFYSMAAYVYRNQLILGTAGGDDGNLGLVSAFLFNGRVAGQTRPLVAIGDKALSNH